MMVNMYNLVFYLILFIGQLLFFVGVFGRVFMYVQGGSMVKGYVVVLNFIMMVVLVNWFIGFVVGLCLVFKKGYEMIVYMLSVLGEYKYIYQGNGIGQEVFGGLGVWFIKIVCYEWVIGVNVGYIFGQVMDCWFSFVIGFGGVVGVEEKISWFYVFNYSFGILYIYKFNIFGCRFFCVSVVYQFE